MEIADNVLNGVLQKLLDDIVTLVKLHTSNYVCYNANLQVIDTEAPTQPAFAMPSLPAPKKKGAKSKHASKVRYFTTKYVSSELKFKNTSALIPDVGLINGVGALSQGKHRKWQIYVPQQEVEG